MDFLGFSGALCELLNFCWAKFTGLKSCSCPVSGAYRFQFQENNPSEAVLKWAPWRDLPSRLRALKKYPSPILPLERQRYLGKYFDRTDKWHRFQTVIFTVLLKISSTKQQDFRLWCSFVILAKMSLSRAQFTFLSKFFVGVD